jgi:hypothetical protein
MVILYVNLINKGLWSIDRVPEIWKEQVKTLLKDSAK